MARIAALIGIALLFSAPGQVRAAVAPLAPQYSSSEPADGEELHQAPDTVTVTFSEPLDPSSEMIVEDHCGNKVDDGNVQVSFNEMSVGIANKPSGHYMVTYAADGIGGVTGTNEGRFSFKVHAGKPCEGANGSGHDGHGGGDGSGHGGHGKHQGSGGGGHSGEHSGTGEHSGSGLMMGSHAGNHSSSAGSPHRGDHGSDPSADAGHDRHSAGDRGEASAQDDDQELADIASGQTPLPDLSPDSMAVLLALIMCAAFGGLGGWLLRVSAQR